MACPGKVRGSLEINFSIVKRVTYPRMRGYRTDKRHRIKLAYAPRTGSLEFNGFAFYPNSQLPCVM